MRREVKQPRRFESTSFVDVSKLHGRDEVKKEIVTILLSEDSMQTISIVGMGGIGKTALAQLIYNDVQFLSVLGCIFLEKLPDGIGKLINLRYLITSNCGNLKYYPKGIARLNCLRELDCIIAQGSKDPKKFSVGDLENLGLLREELKVKLVGNTFHVEEAKGAKLHNKIHLQNLTILNARLASSAFLDALNPHPNTRFL
ncbi:hypothetical protein POUND7_019679 [Theobroma cacao]